MYSASLPATKSCGCDAKRTLHHCEARRKLKLTRHLNLATAKVTTDLAQELLFHHV